ncbi:MAG: transporter substrate-binding protein [Planctomycetes bacterium]|nr:transporter substrate-binding protein [Planctomycetota bacterium]
MPRRPATRSRRAAVRDGWAATLAAVRALGPVALAGCGLPTPTRTVTIGLLHSQTGPVSISATPVRDAQIHAVEEINAGGGLLGRQIEFTAPDTRSRADLFPNRARRLLDGGAVALFGCWSTPSRKAVIPVVEEYRRLLFYGVPYEGNESSKYVVYGGQIPNQQVLPVLDWLQSAAGGLRRRLFVIGSDDLHGRTMTHVVRRALIDRALQFAGVTLVPLTAPVTADTVETIAASGADCVLSTLAGTPALALFSRLAEAGLDPRRLPVVSTTIGEDELRLLRPEVVAGHYAVSAYFQRDPGAANGEWIAGFRREFGFDRVTSDTMETGYSLLHLWAAAVRRAGSVATGAVLQALRDGVSFAGPGGRLAMDPATQHCAKPCRIGRIRTDRQFDVVHESSAPIPPDPYPALAFPGWSCDWTKEGVVRGAEVKLDGDL